MESNEEVYSDVAKIHQLFYNIIGNANKFTNKGTIEVNINQTLLSDFELKLDVIIQDNGIGIPTDKMKQLFDLDSDFKRKGTSNEMGTGLGLVLVKDFVKMSQGELFVESEEGKGSTFSFTLPASAPKG